MDVGFYLGELLMQQGEVSVPGLGYFVQVQMSGYYDETEGKFYPPYHQAQFDIQSLDDDSLAEYIANKKGISVASARYFAEKYITTLKQEALIGEVPIGNLGWFYTELTQLTFRPAEKIIDDTIFYGFDPIKINKAGHIEPQEERPKVELVFPKKLIHPEVTPEVPLEEPEPEPVKPARVATYDDDANAGVSPEFFETSEEEEEEEGTNTVRILLIILAVIVLLGASVFALYRYKPDTFNKLAFWKHKAVVIVPVKPKPAPVADSVQKDTITRDTIVEKLAKDTVAKAAVTTKKVETTTPKATIPATKTTVITEKTTTAPKATTPQPKATVIEQKKPVVIVQKPVVPAATNAGTFQKAIVKDQKPVAAVPQTEAPLPGTSRFEVIGATCRDMNEVNIEVKKFRSVGLSARIVVDAPGPLKKLSIGTFKTYNEAKDYAVKIIESGKVRGDVYPIEIKTP